MYKKLIIESKFNSYFVEFANTLNQIVDLTKRDNTITIVDKNLCRLYPELNDDSYIQFDCIEENKSLLGVELILDELINRNAKVSTTLVVIGGGIMQDVAGYCASIYCRGINYILVPTTLLSQVDSCIGGKTSINYKNKKNILGTFYPPEKILIYTEFLKTLSHLDYLSGWGEIYKFHILENKIFEFPSKHDITDIIFEGLSFKNSILKLDEFDKRERKYLNFGHTFAHALESASNYKIPHGIAVIIGSMIELNVSIKHSFFVDKYDEYISIGIDMIKKSNLLFDENWFELKFLLPFIMADKKNTEGINMVLINQSPVIQKIDNLNLLKESVKEVYESIRLRN